jgi:hypothetical protein
MQARMKKPRNNNVISSQVVEEIDSVQRREALYKYLEGEHVMPPPFLAKTKGGGVRMKKWFTCKEVCSRWEINEFDLMNLVNHRQLTAFDEECAMICVSSRGFYKERRDGETSILFKRPITADEVTKFIFLVSHVEDFEKKRGITPRKVEPDKENQQEKNTVRENEKSTLSAHENAFVHNGASWEIWFKGIKLKSIKNMNGLTYIANLLLNPGKIIHVTSLCNSIGHAKNIAMLGEDELKASLKTGAMSESEMKDDGLDDKAKAEYSKRILDLKETIADTDMPESVRKQAQLELNDFLKIINSQYVKNPLHYRARRKVNAEIKKELDRAGKAISRALEKIHDQSPELAKYLKKSISTGTLYSFTDTGTTWHISI